MNLVNFLTSEHFVMRMIGRYSKKLDKDSVYFHSQVLIKSDGKGGDPSNFIANFIRLWKCTVDLTINSFQFEYELITMKMNEADID